MMQIAQLAAIVVTGIEAESFLQGQLTCDLRAVSKENFSLGAHCNREGRMISLFFIRRNEEGFALYMPENVIPLALAHLKKYAIFAKVTFTVCPGSLTQDAEKQFWLTEMRSGQAFLMPESIGKFLPQEINLDKRGGVSFNKGCYLGQEIIARLHFRGQLKTKLILFSTPNEPKFETAEIVCTLQDRQIYYGLAIIRSAGDSLSSSSFKIIKTFS